MTAAEPMGAAVPVEGSTESAAPPWLVLACVALAGAGTMIVELGAVRLLAPWFGTSSLVWTDVIGVILAALALGYWIGARLARRAGAVRRLGLTLLLGSALVAWLPFGAGMVASWLMPAEGLRLGAAAGVLTWGSLAASAILFLPAAAVLGTAGPLAVESIQRLRGGAAGDAGGRVLACSTLGSLAGTFGTTHVLVPGLGPGGAMLVAAAGLAAAGLLLLLSSKRSPGGAAGIAVALACGGALAHALADTARAGQGLAPDERLVTAVESELQSLAVVERTGPDGAPVLRQLKVNEGLDSFQSVWTPERGLLPPGHYYNLFALPLTLETRASGAAPESWRTYVVGVGAGTAMRVIEGIAPADTALEFVGTEIDPEVLELGEAHFELGDESRSKRTLVGGLDGRAGLRQTEGSFDQIIVDAYSNNMEIPPHLVTTSAFREARMRLREKGWLTVNVGGFGADDPVVRRVAATVALAFDGRARIARVPFSRNWVVFAREGGDLPEPGSRAFGSRDAPLPGGLDRICAALEVPGSWVVAEPSGPDGPAPLSDGHSPTESLQMASIQGSRRSLDRIDRLDIGSGTGGAEPVEGDLEAKQEARRLMGEGELEPAFEAASSIGSPILRATLKAEVLWRAGAPVDALEVATGALDEHGAGDPELLRLAADLAFVAGATGYGQRALERLAVALGPAPGEWWDAEVERLRGIAAGDEGARTARAAGARRAALSLGAVAAAVLAALVLARRL